MMTLDEANLIIKRELADLGFNLLELYYGFYLVPRAELQEKDRDRYLKLLQHKFSIPTKLKMYTEGWLIIPIPPNYTRE